jgi:hypothetical protein
MSLLLNVVIDLTEADAGLSQGEMEARSLRLADELKSGKLVEMARLARQTDLPEGAKAGMLAFIGAVLTAEISRENLKKTVNFLGNYFYGKTLTLEYEADGLKCSIPYRNAAEMEQAIAGVERLQNIRLRVTEKKTV